MKNYFIAYGTILNTRMDIKEMEEKVNHALNMDTAGLVRFGIKEISENQNRRISSSLLNDVLMDAVAHNPTPTDKGRRLKIYYMTQVAVKPPTFVVFVNDPELLHFSYERFLENRIRDSFDFEGTPFHLIARQKK